MTRCRETVVADFAFIFISEASAYSRLNLRAESWRRLQLRLHAALVRHASYGVFARTAALMPAD